MANVNKTVEVIFNATDNVSSKTKAIGSSITGITGPIAGATTSILTVEAAAAAAAAALGGLAITLAGDFQVNMKSIGTLSDATGQQMQQLGGDILTFAATSTSSLDQLQKSTFDAQSAGIKFEDSILALGAAEKLGVAGHTDNATAMKLLTNTMNGMGLEANDLGNISDTLFATMQGGVTTIGEMSSTFALITPSAQAAGISLDEVGAAFSTVTAVTGNSAIATTQLTALFNELSKPTKGLSDGLKTLGIDASSASFQSKDLASKMDLLLQATGGSAEKTKLLFGSLEAGSAAFIIAQGGLAKYNAELDRQANKNGLVEASYKSLIDTLNNQTQIAVNAATVSLTQFGEPLLASFTDVASGVGAIFQALGVSISAGALSDITDAINVWANGLATQFDGIAAAMPAAFNLVDFTPLLDALSQVSGSLGTVFDGLDLTKPQDLALAMNKVIDVIAGFVTATAGVFDVLVKLASLILDAVNAWADLDVETQNLIGTLGGVAIAITAVAPALGTMSKALGLGSDGLLGMASSSSKLVSSLGKAGLVGAAGAAGFALGTLIEENMGQPARDTIQAFIGWIDQATGGLISSSDAVAALNNQPVPFDKITQAAITNADAILKSADSMQKQMDTATQAGISDADYAARLAEVSAAATEQKKSVDAATSSTEQGSQGLVGYATAADGTNTAIFQAAGAIDANTAAQDKNIAKTEDALSAQQEMAIEFAKIDSAASVKVFEIKSKVDIAQLQEATKLVQSSFDSVDATVQGSGDLLLGLFDQLNGADSGSASTILAAIGTAQSERTAALALQKQLVQSQIAAANSIVLQGNTPAVLEVNAGDLEIELEAFMWKILDRIQIRAATDKLEYLKGLASGAVVP